MRFYGQEKLLEELRYIAEEVKKGNNQNVLFIAQSGYGKSALANIFSNWCVKQNEIEYIIANKDVNINWLDHSKKVIWIDEIHMLDSFEWLYTFLDSKKFTFVFCTNEYGDLPEPLIRRCFSFFFEPYTEENYLNILAEYFLGKEINLSEELIKEILLACKRTPGYVLKTAERLSIVFKNFLLPTTKEELNELMINVLGIKGGLDLLDQRYIDTLKSLGGISGLERIVLYSRIPRKVIEREIEPFLMEKKIISITTKGRKIND